MTPESLDRMNLALKQERLCRDVNPISGDTLLALAYSYEWTYPTTAEVLMQVLPKHIYFVIMWPQGQRN